MPIYVQFHDYIFTGRYGINLSSSSFYKPPYYCGTELEIDGTPAEKNHARIDWEITVNFLKEKLQPILKELSNKSYLYTFRQIFTPSHCIVLEIQCEPFYDDEIKSIFNAHPIKFEPYTGPSKEIPPTNCGEKIIKWAENLFGLFMYSHIKPIHTEQISKKNIHRSCNK